MLFYCPVYNLFTIIFTLQPYKADGVLLSLVVALDLWIWKQNHNINQITCSKIQNSCRRSVITDIYVCVCVCIRTHACTHTRTIRNIKSPTNRLSGTGGEHKNECVISTTTTQGGSEIFFNNSTTGSNRKLSLEAGNPTTLITVRGTKICQTINVFATNIQSIIGESFISFM